MTLPMAPSQLFDLLALLSLEEEGLLADDMQACLEGCLCHFIVLEVGGCHVHDLDAVLALCLLCEEGLVIGIAACGIHVELSAEVDAALGIDVKCRSHELEIGVVHQGAEPVLVTDLAGAAAAYDTPSERPCNLLFTVDHFLFLLF